MALNNRGTAALVVNSAFPETPARGTAAVLNTRTLRVAATPTRRPGMLTGSQ
jgi:hypothetical protein